MNIIMADDSFNSSSLGHVICRFHVCSEEGSNAPSWKFFFSVFIYIFLVIIFLVLFLSYWTIGINYNQRFQCRGKGCYYCTLGYEWERMKTIWLRIGRYIWFPTAIFSLSPKPRHVKGTRPSQPSEDQKINKHNSAFIISINRTPEQVDT